MAMGEYSSVGRMDQRSRLGNHRSSRKNSRVLQISGCTLMRHLWAALFAIFVVGPIAFVWADRRIPVNQLSNTVLNSPRPGEDLIYEVVVNRIRTCATTVEFQIKDSSGILYVLQDIDYSAQVGSLGIDQYRRIIHVPSTAAPGPAILRVGLAWQCNPIQRIYPIVLLLDDIQFTISK